MGRMSFVISTLLVLAVATTLLAGALFTGVLSIGPGGLAEPTPSPSRGLPTLLPPASAGPSISPSASPPPTALPTAGGTHIVESGESLSTIGERYGVPWQLIAEVNGIPEPYVIHVGQSLMIPASGAQPSGETGIHIVQSGESITSIALEYGITPTELADANPDVLDWNLIFVGQRLMIPDGSATPDPDPEPSATP